MSQYKLDAREVTVRAKGQWDRIFASLAPELGPAMDKPGRHVPCPVHGGTDGFRLHKHKWIEDGVGICNTCSVFDEKYQNGLGILMWLTNDPFPKILEDVALIVAPELLDADRRRSAVPPAARRAYTPPVRTKKQVDEDRSLVQRMRDVWVQGVGISDPSAALAWRYFESRGLPVPKAADGLDATLRFVPSLAYYDDETKRTEYFPAIVALVQNAEGNARAIHRTYLARDGWGKAPVEYPKKLMAKPDMVPLSTCAIRLGRPARVIGVTEGLECARAVQAFTGFTCWATISAVFMRQFLPPAGVEAVHIFGDLDRSGVGREAAEALKAELLSRGYAVRCDLPPGPIPVGEKGVDWHDLYREHGSKTIHLVESLRPALASRKVIQFPQGARRAG